MFNGMTATITDYKCDTNITVKFEDGTIVPHTTMAIFKKFVLTLEHRFVGKKYRLSSGETCKVVDVFGSDFCALSNGEDVVLCELSFLNGLEEI